MNHDTNDDDRSVAILLRILALALGALVAGALVFDYHLSWREGRWFSLANALVFGAGLVAAARTGIARFLRRLQVDADGSEAD